MAQTVQQYTGNGSTNLYSIPFPYIEQSDIKVRVDGVDTTAFTFANATTIQFNTAPASQAAILIFRQTDDTSSPHTLASGSALKAQDLNDNFQQNLFINQETVNQAASSLGTTFTGDVHFGIGNKIHFEGSSDDANETTLTVENPTADRTITFPNVSGNVVTTGDTGTVTNGMLAGNSVDSSKIADGSIVNADINGSAAIAGTKITPNFGSQNIVTTGTGATGNLGVTGNITVSGTVDGRDVSVDGTKLDTVETNAKDDQTAAEIRTLVESASDSNVFTDADHTKLNGIETGATADQTNAEIRAAVEAASDSNVFTDADHTKLNGIETGATADQTASEIKSLIASSPLDASHLAANSVTTSEIADAELTTLAGMQSGTASKLADSTALTSDIADLNQLDGMAKQTTITNSDSHFPTSGAVVDFVANQIAPVGGLEVIADEDSFPSTQPVSGVVISISNADGLVINSSGVATNARTLGNGSDNVTINNFPTSLRSKTLSNELGLLVSSTGASQVYNYHKLLAKETDVLQLSDDINDFNNRYRVGSSNPTSENDSGDMFFNTTTGKMLVYDGTESAWEEVQSIGNFFISTFSESFDGSRTAFTVSNAPLNAQQLIISINGVIQKPNSGTGQPSEGFTLSGSTVTFSSAIPSGSDYFVIVLGSSVNSGTPSNNTVTSAILQNGSVIEAKLGNGAVTRTKLNLVSTSSAAGLEVKGDNTSDGYLQLNCSQNSHGVKIKSPPHSANQNYTLTLPSSIVNGAFLKTDSNGNLSFAAVDLTSLSASNLTSGTIPDARFPATLPAASGANLTNLPAGNLTGTLPALDGSNLTGLQAGATGGNSGANAVFWENDQTITHDYTISTNKNAGSFGSLTINNGVTVTVPNNSTWTIV